MNRWFDRAFALGLPAAAAPAVLGRLRGTAARLRQATRDLPPAVLVHRPGGRWSIQENIGHLLDLESLWDRRLDDFEAGAEVLHPADLQNRRTHEARHNERGVADVLADFAAARERILQRLARMDDAGLARVALHPRLRQPMSVVDLGFFVAEHDDHHIATIDQIARSLAGAPEYALDLANTIDRVEPVLRSFSDERTAARPAPGKWSPREIVGHLIDSASNNHQRFVRAMFQDDLVFPGYAQDDWVAAQRYQDAPWQELVTLWASFNRHLARVMLAVPEAVRTRPHGRHSLHRIAFRAVREDEPATLDFFMADYVLHLHHHLRQIEPRIAPDDRESRSPAADSRR
jgi:uncharacterized damage-inducible protein DinB